MIRATTYPWGISIPAHPEQRLAPKTRADAVRQAAALRMLADHLEKVGATLPHEGADDRHATPHMLMEIDPRPRIDAVAQPTGVSITGRFHSPLRAEIQRDEEAVLARLG